MKQSAPTRHTISRTVEMPLLPGYLFLSGHLEDCYEAYRTTRVKLQIIPVNDQAKLTWELKNLAMVLDQEVTLDPYPYLVKKELGWWVRGRGRCRELRGSSRTGPSAIGWYCRWMCLGRRRVLKLMRHCWNRWNSRQEGGHASLRAPAGSAPKKRKIGNDIEL